MDNAKPCHTSIYYINIGAVCPPRLRNAKFTTGAVDNIKHKFSSTTSTSSFHCRGISLFQNISVDNSPGGYGRDQWSAQIIVCLFVTYTNITPISILGGNSRVSPRTGRSLPTVIRSINIFMRRCWIETYMTETTSESNISWAAYHNCIWYKKGIVAV